MTVLGEELERLRFFLRAFREADPDFGEEKDPDTGDDMMSREWLIRRMR